jgi:hypothetical protein
MMASSYSPFQSTVHNRRAKNNLAPIAFLREYAAGFNSRGLSAWTAM